MGDKKQVIDWFNVFQTLKWDLEKYNSIMKAGGISPPCSSNSERKK